MSRAEVIRDPSTFKAGRVLALALLLSGCSSTMFKNTPAQDLAWERWQRCSHFASVQLERIDLDGRVWALYRVDAERAAWTECMRQAALEQQRAGKLTAAGLPVSAVASGSTTPPSNPRALLEYAFLTAETPQPGTHLRSALGRTVPKETKEFRVGQSVTFFYALKHVGKVFKTEGRWSNPAGNQVRTIVQTMSQLGIPGSWTWLTQTLTGEEVDRAGVWAVELLVDGQSVGRYSFRVLETTGAGR